MKGSESQGPGGEKLTIKKKKDRRSNLWERGQFKGEIVGMKKSRNSRSPDLCGREVGGWNGDED